RSQAEGRRDDHDLQGGGRRDQAATARLRAESGADAGGWRARRAAQADGDRRRARRRDRRARATGTLPTGGRRTPEAAAGVAAGARRGGEGMTHVHARARITPSTSFRRVHWLPRGSTPRVLENQIVKAADPLAIAEVASEHRIVDIAAADRKSTRLNSSHVK